MGLIFQITNLAEFAMLLLMHFLLVFCYHTLLSREGEAGLYYTESLTILGLDRVMILPARTVPSRANLFFKKTISLPFFMKYNTN